MSTKVQIHGFAVILRARVAGIMERINTYHEIPLLRLVPLDQLQIDFLKKHVQWCTWHLRLGYVELNLIL